MATTMLPPTTAPRPSPGDVRYVAVRANLVPDEVISARQADVIRKRVLRGLAAFAVVLVGWYGMSWWQTRSANNELSAAQQQGIALQAQQNQFSPLVRAQGDINTVNAELKQLMASDLPWKKMLSTIRSVAPSGVTLTGVTGQVSSGQIGVGAAPNSSPSILNDSGLPAVGQLNITGSAPDKRTVATYADQLAKVKGLSGPLISSVEGSTAPITFSITVVITSDALGGRYSSITVDATTTGGH